MRRLATIVSLVATFALTACEGGGAGAYARVATSASELVGGPGASGEIGDIVLGNDAIRVVIARRKPSQSVLPVTGIIVDASPMRAGADATEGRDHLEGVLPLVMVAGFDPETEADVVVVDDGSRGGPAVVRASARPRDLLRALEVLGGDITPNRDLLLETDYVLEPNARHVRVISRLINRGEQDALIDGSVLRRQLDLAGSTAPGSIELLFGDALITGARARLFVPTAIPGESDRRPVGFDIAAGDALARAAPPALPAIPGMLTDLLAAVGDGVSYGLSASVPRSVNAVQRAPILYGAGGQTIPASDPMVVSYATEGGAAVHFAALPERLAPGESFEVTRYFLVGDGDVGGLRQELLRVKGAPSGVLVGEVVQVPGGEPFAGAELVIYDADQQPYSHLVADDRGRFRTVLPPGSYFLRAVASGAPATPTEASLLSGIDVVADGSVYRRIALTRPARIVVRASDPSGRILPVKVSVVGEYDATGQSEPVERLVNELAMGERRRPTDLGELQPLLERTSRYVESVEWGDGQPVSVAVRPTRCDSVPSCSVGARVGPYRVVVSRGPEYEIAEVRGVEVGPGEVAAFDVTLEKTVDTEGYLAVDFDLETAASVEGRFSPVERARAAAAEGLEAYFGADHNRVMQAEGEPARAGVQEWVRAFDAVELTTLERGQNLVLPVLPNPTRANGLPDDAGCIVGSGADTLGVVVGGFECSIAQLFARTRTLGSRGSAFSVLVASHPRRGIAGQLNQFSVAGDGEASTPSPLNDIWRGWPLSTTYRDGALDPETLSLGEYDGLVVWHGKATSNLRDFRPPSEAALDPGVANDLLLDLRNFQCGDGHPNNALGGVVYREGGDIRHPGPLSDYERQLALGRPMAAFAASGSGGPDEEPGAPRTWVWVGSDEQRGVIDRRPAGVIDADILNGIFQGRMLLSNGPFLDLRIRTRSADGSDVVLWPVGSFIRFAEPPDPDVGTAVTALLRLRSPSWIRVETVRLLVNGEVVESLEVPDALRSDGTPVANEWLFPVELRVFEDAFVTAEAVGEESLFPVVTPYQRPRGGLDGALGAIASAFGLPDPYPRGDGLRAPTPVDVARPYAVTNPIIFDVDASGAFRGPGVPPLPAPAPQLPCPPGLE